VCLGLLGGGDGGTHGEIWEQPLGRRVCGQMGAGLGGGGRSSRHCRGNDGETLPFSKGLLRFPPLLLGPQASREW